MYLQQLRFQNLRNHTHTEIDCPKGIIFLSGDNGAGKTTVLEAVSLLCMSRSFVSTQDKSLLQRDSDNYRTNGFFVGDNGASHHVSIMYPNSRQRKDISYDYERIISASDLIGIFPLVILAPQHHSLISGGPAERRAFIDIILAQAHHAFLLDLIEYKRVLKHRNALLSNTELSHLKIKELLEPWNEWYVSLAVKIIKRRMVFVNDFSPHAIRVYESISQFKEALSMRYRSTFEIDMDDDEEIILEKFKQKVNDLIQIEIKRGTTLLGPHRDDLEIYLNNFDVRQHASQGQIKTLLIALKLAEYSFLEERMDEKPIMLLDDVFSELDQDRLHGVMNMIDGLGQTFITSVNENAINLLPHLSNSHITLRVKDGTVMQYE